MKSFKDIKQLHQILAGVTLKHLNVTISEIVLGETETESEEIATENLDYQSIFCCQEPRNTF